MHNVLVEAAKLGNTNSIYLAEILKSHFPYLLLCICICTTIYWVLQIKIILIHRICGHWDSFCFLLFKIIRKYISWKLVYTFKNKFMEVVLKQTKKWIWNQYKSLWPVNWKTTLSPCSQLFDPKLRIISGSQTITLSPTHQKYYYNVIILSLFSLMKNR